LKLELGWNREAAGRHLSDKEVRQRHQFLMLEAELV